MRDDPAHAAGACAKASRSRPAAPRCPTRPTQSTPRRTTAGSRPDHRYRPSDELRRPAAGRVARRRHRILAGLCRTRRRQQEMKAAGSAVEVVEAQRLDRARRAERHPPPGRERQIELSRRRRRRVPVAETDQPVAVHHCVVRRRILMAHDQARSHRAADEPPFVRRRHEAHRRVMDPSQPSADLYQSRVRVRPSGPGNTVADHLAGQVSEHLTPLLIEAECPGNPVNTGILQVPQQGVYRRRPR